MEFILVVQVISPLFDHGMGYGFSVWCKSRFSKNWEKGSDRPHPILILLCRILIGCFLSLWMGSNRKTILSFNDDKYPGRSGTSPAQTGFVKRTPLEKTVQKRFLKSERRKAQLLFQTRKQYDSGVSRSCIIPQNVLSGFPSGTYSVGRTFFAFLATGVTRRSRLDILGEMPNYFLNAEKVPRVLISMVWRFRICPFVVVSTWQLHGEFDFAQIGNGGSPDRDEQSGAVVLPTHCVSSGRCFYKGWFQCTAILDQWRRFRIGNGRDFVKTWWAILDSFGMGLK